MMTEVKRSCRKCNCNKDCVKGIAGNRVRKLCRKPSDLPIPVETYTRTYKSVAKSECQRQYLSICTSKCMWWTFAPATTVHVRNRFLTKMAKYNGTIAHEVSSYYTDIMTSVYRRNLRMGGSSNLLVNTLQNTNL